MTDIKKVTEGLPLIAELLYARYKDATDRQDKNDWLEHYNIVIDALEIIKQQVNIGGNTERVVKTE